MNVSCVSTVQWLSGLNTDVHAHTLKDLHFYFWGCLNPWEGFYPDCASEVNMLCLGWMNRKLSHRKNEKIKGKDEERSQVGVGAF